MNDVPSRQRIADQMITAYSVLRDRYARRATILTLTIFFSSVILCVCTFLSDASLARVGFSEGSVTLIIGIASSIVLFASIVELNVGWKEKAKEYGLAADKLAEYKIRCQSKDGAAVSDSNGADEKESADAYREVMRNLPRIPDVQFVKLKAYHLRKVQLSKMADDNIGCPIIMLRISLFWSSLTRLWRSCKTGGSK